MVYTNKKLISSFPNARTRNLIACVKFKHHSTRYQLLKKAVRTVVTTSHCEGQNLPTIHCPTNDEVEEEIHSFIAEENQQEPEQQCEAICEPINTLKEDNINLLVAYTLHGCNLSSSCERKIYNLMQVLTMKQQELPTYRQYKNYVDNLCPISAYKFKYCYDHDNFEAESQLCCYVEGKGNLVVFSLLDSITALIERNYTYISCPSDHGANGFINSQTYQDLWSNFNEGLRVTLIISIDDASMVKSNKVCTTPVAFTCAELPQYRRICKENIYNLGIFMGNRKVNVNTLLKQVLLEPLQVLGVITSTCTDEPCYSQESVILDTCYGVKNVYIKVGMIVTDSVEKYKVLNHKAFNGEYGCPYCCQRGESSQTDKGTRTYVYKYAGPTTLKDHAFYVRNSRIAERDGIVRFGIKGKTNISSIITLPLQVPIDYMHAILEGNFKFLMSLEPFNNMSVIKVVDEYISFIKLPHDSSRRFRSLSDIKYWKASEARTFLFYLIPILRDLVDPDAFILLCLLSVLTRILCSHESFRIDSMLIKSVIKIFLESFQIVYGLAKMRFNVHLMSHIMDQFRSLGSLVEASSFVFENNIYNLKRSFHGTRGQLDQMCRAYLRSKSFVECNQEILTNFMQQDSSHSLSNNVRNHTNNNSQVLGNPDTNFQYNDCILTLLSNNGIDIDGIEIYHQFKNNHQVYHSEGYKYRRGSCSYAVSYKHEFNLFYAIVKFFMRSHQEMHEEIYAVVNDLQVLDSQFICRSGIQPTVTQMRSPLVKNTINTFFRKARTSTSLKLIKAGTICNKIILVPVATTARNSSQSFWLSECNITIDHD